MDLDQVKQLRRQELLNRLHNKVNSKQATRMNKLYKNKKVEEIKERLSQGNANVKEDVEKMIKKVKKKNKKKNKTQAETLKDLQKDMLPKMNNIEQHNNTDNDNSENSNS